MRSHHGAPDFGDSSRIVCHRCNQLWPCTVDRLETQNEQLNARLEEQRRRAHLAETERDEALAELERLRQQNAALQGQIDMMEAEIAAKESEWAVAHLGAKVRLLNRVLDAARDLHRITGHNLPGWIDCLGPRPCAWERLDMALTAVDQAQADQQESS